MDSPQSKPTSLAWEIGEGIIILGLLFAANTREETLIIPCLILIYLSLESSLTRVLDKLYVERPVALQRRQGAYLTIMFLLTIGFLAYRIFN